MTELTLSEKATMLAYVKDRGRKWREILLFTDWPKASYPGMNEVNSTTLQHIRNTRGPSWLATVKAADIKRWREQLKKVDVRISQWFKD